MKGDFTRNTFSPARHYTGVRMQQGRVQLDADWNEQVDIRALQRRQALRDIVGRAGGPAGRAGFKIASPDGQRLTIGGGRYYVDGLEVDNEPYDGSVPFEAQPFLPGVDQTRKLAAGNYLFYLEAWERHVTALEDPHLREVALGGPDTATRSQVVWQVKLARVGAVGDALDCSAVPAGWRPAGSASTGSMDARVQPPAPAAGDDCLLPPQGGYRGLENQLYRIEIHAGGSEQQATFKWSRENGSVVMTWQDTQGLDVRLGGPGRDRVLSFQPGSWVELTSDERELVRPPGTLANVQAVAEEHLTLAGGTATGPTDPAGFTGVRVARRWEGYAPVQDFLVWRELELGLQVRFAAGVYHPGDYWLIPARARVGGEAGDIEWPPPGAAAGPQPAAGIHRAHAVLALASFQNAAWTRLTDCRRIFPPLTELTGAPDAPPASTTNDCCCTVTVGDGVLSHGDFDDLQAGIDYARSLRRAARVCLLPGTHALRRPIWCAADDISRRITLAGCGWASGLVFAPPDARLAIEVKNVLAGRSVTLGLHNLAAGRRYAVLARPEGEPAAAWTRIGEITSAAGGEMPLAAALPEHLQEARRLSVRLAEADAGDAADVAEIGYANRPEKGAWIGTPAAPAGTQPMLVLGDYVTLQDLVINGRTPNVPAVLALGDFIEIQRSVLAGEGAPALVLRGRDIRVSRCMLGGEKLAALCLAEDAIFEDNHFMLGMLQIARGSARVIVRHNRFWPLAADGQTASGVWLEPNLAGAGQIMNMAARWQPSLAIRYADLRYGDFDRVLEDAGIADVLIDANQFRDLRAAIVTNLQLTSSQIALHGLTIRANHIEGCEGKAGNIIVAGAAGLRILDNEIVRNGTALGGVGILLVDCQGVEISRNLVESNGQAQAGSQAIQAGIAAFYIRSMAGRPAAIVHENTVVTQAGQALILVGLGDMVVTDNSLTARGAVEQLLLSRTAPQLAAAGLAQLVTAGGAAVIVAGLGSNDDRKDNDLFETRVKFSGNQVTFHSPAHQLQADSPATQLLALGSDLSVQDNQFTWDGLLDSDAPHEQAVSANANTVRVLGNAFFETPGRVLFSCISNGDAANLTTNNQAVHCLLVLPRNRVNTLDAQNQVLVGCPGAGDDDKHTTPIRRYTTMARAALRKLSAFEANRAEIFELAAATAEAEAGRAAGSGGAVGGGGGEPAPGLDPAIRERIAIFRREAASARDLSAVLLKRGQRQRTAQVPRPRPRPAPAAKDAAGEKVDDRPDENAEADDTRHEV